MFCQNCGKQLPDNARFCTNCGASTAAVEASAAPVNSEPASDQSKWVEAAPDLEWSAPTASVAPSEPEPAVSHSAIPNSVWQDAPAASQKAPYSAPVQTPAYTQTQPTQAPIQAGIIAEEKKSRKLGPIIGIAVAAVAVIAAVAVVLSSGLLSSPASKFIKYNTKAIDAVAAPAVETICKVNDGDLAFSTDMELSVKLDNLSDFDDAISDSSLKLQIDQKSAKEGALALRANIMGETDLDAAIRWNQEQLGLYLPEIGKKFYTIKYSTVFDMVKEMDPDIGDMASTVEKSLDSGKFLEISESDLKEFISRYEDVLFSTVSKDNITTEKSVELSGLNSTAACTVYTFKPSEKNITATIELLADTMKEDELIDQLLGSICEYMFAVDGSYYYDSVKEYAKETRSEFKDMMEELKDSAEDYAEELADSGFYWRIAVKGNRLYQIRIGNEDYSIAYESFGEPSSLRADALVFYDGDEVDYVPLYNEYSKSGSEYSGEFIFSDGYDDYSLTYTTNPSKSSILKVPYGSYKTTVDGMNIRVEIQEAANGGTEHSVKFSYDNESIRVYLITSDKKSTIDNYKGVDSKELKDEDDLYEFIVEAVEAYEDVLVDLIG